MKKIFLLITFFLVFPNICFTQSGWLPENPPVPPSDLNAVSFSDINSGTIVGDNYVIVRTTNGGVSWNFQNSGVSFNFYGVSFTDVNNGIAVGYALTARTTNGGLNWIQQPNLYCLFSICLLDTINGIAVGQTGDIVRTTNGGINWYEQTSATTQDLFGVSFANINVGTAVGTNGTIIHTINGGLNWNLQTGGTTVHLWGVSFKNADTGIIIGQGGTILRTTNGGANWSSQSSGTSNELFGISFINANTGTVVGKSGTILRTTNGGINWYLQSSGIAEKLEGVSFADVNNGTAVGEKPFSGWVGRIIHTTNGGVNWYQQSITALNEINAEIPKTYSLEQNYPNPFNPSTKIRFALPERSPAMLVIFDMLGREVATLVNEELIPGTYEADWDGSNFSSGVYFYKIISGDYIETKKMVLMK